ncbi:MAG TPA: hypothetical protein VJ992_04870 [Gemmatimonadales bacterium]|nr:hypothetical protein [Gemmatimonadales bacterium]
MTPVRAALGVLAALLVTGVPSAAQQPDRIARAQRTMVVMLDSTLPAVPFAQWLAQTAGVPSSAIRWEVNDCGEGGDGLAAPTCVEAAMDLAPDTAAHVSLILADTAGHPAAPAVWLLYVTADTTVTYFKRLPDWAAFIRRRAH